jgi:hypothetical protein
LSMALLSAVDRGGVLKPGQKSSKSWARLSAGQLDVGHPDAGYLVGARRSSSAALAADSPDDRGVDGTAADGIGRCLIASDHAAAFCVDEHTALQALDARACLLPPQPQPQPKRQPTRSLTP